MTACCPARRPSPRAAGFWQECSCALLGGLLCSSCCLIQLLLNSFSIGCAGFSALTSYRPALLAVTATTLIGNYLKYRNKQRTALAVAVAFGLTVTPELVQAYNQNRLSTLLNPSKWPNYSKAQNLARHEEWIFSVSGLKCQACCARLKRHILEHGAVESCNVDFDQGELRVRGKTLQERRIVTLIEQLGYEAHLVIDSDSNGSKQRDTAQCTDSDEQQ